METKKLFRGLIIICLVFTLLGTVIMGACAKEKETTKPPVSTKTDIAMLGMVFGSGMYDIFTGITTIAGEKNSPLKLNMVEMPGGVFEVTELCTNESYWTNSACTCHGSTYGMAFRGVGPFTEPLPQMKDMRFLFTVYTGLMGFYTLNKDLVDVNKLNGKRVATGRAGQIWWNVLHEFALEAHGVKANIDKLGPNESLTALLDGVADAAVMVAYASGDHDLKTVQESPSLKELVGSGRDFYYVQLNKEVLEAAFKAVDYKLEVRELPPNTLPNQPDPVVVWWDPIAVMVHKTFPENDAYEFTKIVLENYQEIPKYTAIGKCLTPDTMIFGYPAELYHPGAIKAYQEAGFWNK